MNGLKIPIPEWVDQAACATHGDPDVFYTPGKEGEAIAVCADCPVALECLNHARARGERHGIWGGVDFGACRRGHPTSVQYLRRDGRRFCRTCERQNDAANKRRKKLAKAQLEAVPA